MDRQWFDAVTRKLTEDPKPRRGAVVLLAGAALSGLLAGAGQGPQAASAAGCAKVGKPCRRSRQCCSGICKGKKRHKTCRGHGSGTCRKAQDHCTNPDPGLDACNNNANCACFRTTAGTSFCADLDAEKDPCAACERDADCVALGFPPGSACGPTATGFCAGFCTNGTACFVPCGVKMPAP